LNRVCRNAFVRSFNSNLPEVVIFSKKHTVAVSINVHVGTENSDIIWRTFFHLHSFDNQADVASDTLLFGSF